MTNCHKKLPPLAAPRSTFLHVQLGSWPFPAAILVCERYIIKCNLPVQDRRALTVAGRAFNDNSLPVTKICTWFIKTTWPWSWSTHHVQSVLTELTTGYSFRLTARHTSIEYVKYTPLRKGYIFHTFIIHTNINARKMLHKKIITNATKE